VTEAAASVGAALAWIGVTVLAVSEARLGSALGLSLVSAGLALSAGAAGQPPLDVAVLAAGGLAAAGLRLHGGPPGWGLMPAGSTPRVVGAIVVLVGAGLVGGSTLASPGAGTGARLAALVVAVLATGRVLTADGTWAALGAGSALALGLGALGGPSALVAGALVAAGLVAIDRPRPARAEE
jgi:hypothetical protein